MRGDRTDLLRGVAADVLAGDGDLPTEVRERAFRCGLAAGPGASGIEGPLGDLVEQVAVDAIGVTDAHVAAALAAGHSEDAVYEAVAAAAVGAGLARFEHGLRAVRAGA